MPTANNRVPSEQNPVDILLVEDNPGDVRLTEESFRDGRLANTLYVVNDGVAALDFLYQRGDYADAPWPQIILLDLNLPRKPGDEVLRELKSDPDLEQPSIIVLIGSDAQRDHVESTVPDADAYLTKPVDPDDFIDTVRSLEQAWLSVVWDSDQDD